MIMKRYNEIIERGETEILTEKERGGEYNLNAP